MFFVKPNELLNTKGDSNTYIQQLCNCVRSTTIHRLGKHLTKQPAQLVFWWGSNGQKKNPEPSAMHCSWIFRATNLFVNFFNATNFSWCSFLSLLASLRANWHYASSSWRLSYFLLSKSLETHCWPSRRLTVVSLFMTFALNLTSALSLSKNSGQWGSRPRSSASASKD
jgi:hypothetical protein